jgi:hypothetical protein
MRLYELATSRGNDARGARILRTMERYYGNMRGVYERSGGTRAGYYSRREYMGLANG